MSTLRVKLALRAKLALRVKLALRDTAAALGTPAGGPQNLWFSLGFWTMRQVYVARS